jgi:hypothetical protein
VEDAKEKYRGRNKEERENISVGKTFKTSIFLPVFSSFLRVLRSSAVKAVLPTRVFQ